MIDKFIYGFIDRVYGADDYTQQEINAKLIQKMDDVIEECNNAFEFVDWLKEQGVPDEVQTIINTMLEDGTLEKIINLEKIEEAKTELQNNINELTTSTEAKLNNMTNSVNTLINENKELINQNKADLNNTITEFKQEANTTINNLKEEVNADILRFKNIVICKNLEEFKTAITSAEQKPTDIYLVSGEYTLDGIVFIPSNTKIIGLGEVTIKATGLNCYFANKTNGQAVEYNGTKNITIKNITFDGLDNSSGLTMIGIAHAENVTVENCTFKNLHKWHMIEFNAVKQGYIKNCKFENYGTSGNGGTEAIQLDSMISESQYPWFGNYDGTANEFIIIEGNSFSNIGVKAIGGHSFAVGSIQKDIFIKNNTFNKVSIAININDFDNLNVTNNNSNSCRQFLVTENVNNNSYNLNVVGNTHMGYYVNSTEGLGDERFVVLNGQGNKGDLRIEHVNILNNHISSCSGHAIGCTANYVTITNNNFYNIAKHGIFHYGGLCSSIIGNTFKDTGKIADMYSIAVGNNSVEKSKGVIVNGNSVANLRGIKIYGYAESIVVTNNVAAISNDSADYSVQANNTTMS